MKSFIVIAMLLMMMTACGRQTTGETAQSVVTSEAPVTLIGVGTKPGSVSSIPKATAFRMSGDFADNVAITLGQDGKLLYYPAPGDISDDSKPVDLGNGWWLNRQGIGAGSVFTKYTFAEYKALKEVPSQAQLLEAVIPGAKVTEMIRLPFSINEAAARLDEIKNYLKTQTPPVVGIVN